MNAADDSGWDQQVWDLVGDGQVPDLAGFLRVLPAGYRQRTSPARAAGDARELARLAESSVTSGDDGSDGPEWGRALGGPHRLVVAPAYDSESTFRLRRLGRAGIELTRTLPLLESFGLIVVEAVPFRMADPADGTAELHIDDIGIRLDAPSGPEALRFVPDIHGARLVEAIEASVREEADVDSLNRLVTAAALDWRQVMVLRAYLRYWSQVVPGMPWPELVDPLAAHPDAARALVAYFLARFDPSGAAASSPTAGGEDQRALAVSQLDLVTHLDAFRILGTILELIDSTWRTNFFRAGYATPRSTGGPPRPPLVLKIDSSGVPEMPPPRPFVDTFVHGPRVEGIHLRAGLIARGGIRWSERPADFRTEILDLAFAQVKKNAIIVPTGAKGGFVVRRPTGTGLPAPTKIRPEPHQIRTAYEQFISALLEVTDDIVDGEVVRPGGVVSADGPDPYLVVAADKGTATFSDLANSLSEKAGFWLGDAFASGGSRGYDHKAMGITARGAWVAVRRHFRELGLDVASDPIRVVGVGDMSGDVFGNGMLRSRAIRLIAAFDHRHVFLDPEPDGDRSFEERARLAALERSDWADYRTELISPGGGVWARDAKLVPLSAPVRAALGVDAEQLRPPDLVSAILAAPVDLIWFGGIGTYIKAVGESDTEVGDHSNDAVRITSDRVRARVIAEGANLGVTQRARIRYSRRGGRINADFIDNAAGVATSDREVNLKILLSLAIERGQLNEEDRDTLLSTAEAEVANEVLRQVDHSVAALNRAAARSDRDLDAYEALVAQMEKGGRFDRGVEVLPDAEEFRVRREAGAGLIRPELATILAYAKADLVSAVEASSHALDPVFVDSALVYFPADMRDRFADLVPHHRLYPQLVATDIAGEVVDQMGIVWAHDLAAELGRDLADIAAAFWVARRLTGADELWRDLELLAAEDPSTLPAPVESALHRAISDSVGDLARMLLRRAARFDPGKAVVRDEAVIAETGILLEAGAQSDQLPADWEALEIPDDTGQHFLVSRRRADLVIAGLIAGAPGHRGRDMVSAARRMAAVAGLDRLVDELHAALERPPIPDRLRVWYTRAVLDDLSDWKYQAAAVALTEAPDLSVDAAVDRWQEIHSQALQSALAMSASAPARSDPLAVVTLTLRRLGETLPGPGA